MDRNAFVAVFLLFLIVADVSDASLLSKIRKLVGEKPEDKPAVTPTPSPSPVTGAKNSKPEPNDGTKKKDDKASGSPVPDGSKTKASPVPQKPNTTVPAVPSVERSSEHGNVETCDGSVKECKDIQNVVACIKSFDEVSKELVVVVQNERESLLKGNISVESFQQYLNISKHQSERINISLSNGKGAKIFIKTANGECMLAMDSPAFGGMAMRLPTYDQLVTPINGAYLLIFSVLVFGGTWACCMFRKRRREDGGVPYQELEMGMAETVSAADLETAEGWDEVWDDDWDEDKAVKSPGGHVGSISANGLTSRTANKDGWDNNWDD